MKMRNLAIALVTLFHLSFALAQTSGGEGRAQQMPPGRAIEDMIVTFESEMTSAARAMPADRYSFSPATLNIRGAQFTKVRTFATEVTHVAQANYAIASNISGKEPQVDLKAIGQLRTKEQILAALSASFAEVHKAIATITIQNENDFVDDIGVGPNQSKISEAAWVAVHGFDHYGQIVEYLRMNGIVPPGVVAFSPPKGQ